MKTILTNLLERAKPRSGEKDNSEKVSYDGHDDRTLLYPVGHKFAGANGIAASATTAANRGQQTTSKIHAVAALLARAARGFYPLN